MNSYQPPPIRSKREIWSQAILVFTIAFAATALVTQQSPISKTVIAIVATTYASYAIVAIPCAVRWHLTYPNARNCSQHFKFRNSRKRAWAAHFATILCPTIAYWTISLVTNDQASLITHLAGAAVLTILYAFIAMKFIHRDFARQLDYHRENDCPETIAPQDATIVDGTVASSNGSQPTHLPSQRFQ